MTDYLEYTLNPPPTCPTNQDHLSPRHAQAKAKLDLPGIGGQVG